MEIIYKLYVKQLPNGKLYLGRTIKDPYKYLGSGTLWKKYIKKYKYTISDIKTWILHETSSFQEMKELGIYYSILFDVVKSDSWLNLIEESGEGLKNPTKELRETLSKAKLGVKRKPFTEETKSNISKGLTGRKLSETHLSNIKKYNQSEEARSNLSNINKGKTLSEDSKRKISNTVKELWASGYYSNRKSRNTNN